MSIQTRKRIAKNSDLNLLENNCFKSILYIDLNKGKERIKISIGAKDSNSINFSPIDDKNHILLLDALREFNRQYQSEFLPYLYTTQLIRWLKNGLKKQKKLPPSHNSIKISEKINF